MSVVGNGAPVQGAAGNVPRRSSATPAIMDGLSSSKVTVEYHDPSRLFPLLEEDLVIRLPLRNLHWKSPTRPLRSIESLHVDLVPSKDTGNPSNETTSSIATPQTGSGAPNRTVEESPQPPVREKERRHQIPGLRQTPYLKIYLLRCDDSETYKTSTRKQIRDWIKEHTPPSQNSSFSTQENHDAYEWMILHVVLPDTPAASQPRGSTGSAGGEKEKGGSTSRWTRGTTTLLEKLRADFNASSKSAPDRIAQVRLQKDQVPPHMLPTVSVAPSAASESLHEQPRAWTDVISKFKTLILLSFDLRVSQYEEDIRKNEAQRSFPGWNFNTFFILKEGLLKGFESVGLVEDALVGYDELSVGLDTVMRDQAHNGKGAQGTVLLEHSDDIYKKMQRILRRSEIGCEDSGDLSLPEPLHDATPINENSKDYRGLILANNISAFDFHMYIFARQIFLLLRLGNPSSTARSDPTGKLQSTPDTSISQTLRSDSSADARSDGADNDNKDLPLLAEVCSRALRFVPSAGRLLRHDLINGAKANRTAIPDSLLDNIVRSWTFTAIEQVLQETCTSSLPFTKVSKDASSASSGKFLAFGSRLQEQKISLTEPKSMVHPVRSSSLSSGRSIADGPVMGGQTAFENGQHHDRPVPNKESVSAPVRNGIQDLAGARAQLLVLQRRLFGQVSSTLGWKTGWVAIASSLVEEEELTDVNLTGDVESSREKDISEIRQSVNQIEPTLGLSQGVLLNALSSFEHFRQFYESLSDTIVKHFMAAGHNKSAESVLGDLAALKFELGDFAAAAMYFGRMASLFAEGRWNTVENMMLKMYAHCLKKLNRKDEYVRTLLDLLAKSAASMILSCDRPHQTRQKLKVDMPCWVDDEQVYTKNVLHEIISFSQNLPYDMSVEMTKYFGDISVEPYIRHYDDQDGFQLRLQFRHLLEDRIQIHSVKVRLISATPAEGKDIWLESSQPLDLKAGLNQIWLGCKVNTTGLYMADKIVLGANRIIFSHSFFTNVETMTPLGIVTAVSTQTAKAAKKARILCYPRFGSFQAHIYLSHLIHIDKPRHIEIECLSGCNEIQRAEIRLKSASAGLRLRTASVIVAAGDASIEDKSNPGVITIGALPANTTTTLDIPFDVETVLRDLHINIEVDYYTDGGKFSYMSSCTISVDLPLDVNVQDHFKNSYLFSKFNIKTANQIPLEVLAVELQGSEEFDVHAPEEPKEPVIVFPKQPVAITYKVTKKAVDSAQKRETRGLNTRGLLLTMEYRCLNEDVVDRVGKLFASAVADSQVHRLGHLLVDTFANRLEQRVLPHQFESIALLEKLNMGAFEDMGWADYLDTLPHVIRDDTRIWLKNWHEQHRTIYLSKDTSSILYPSALPSSRPPRRMIIAVSIPQTHVLHTASLIFNNPTMPSLITTVGCPLTTTLRISHTRRWGRPASLASVAGISSPSEPINFIYTVDANPELWLIAGQRRTHFSATEDQVLEWPIVLIPLKTGNLLLPNVNIRVSFTTKEEEQSGSLTREQESLQCETDYLSYGESVKVIPDISSSTVGIGGMELSNAKNVVWLESVGRGG